MNSRDTAQQQSAFMWLPAASEESRDSTWLLCLKGITAVREVRRESMAGAEIKAGQM